MTVTGKLQEPRPPILPHITIERIKHTKTFLRRQPVLPNKERTFSGCQASIEYGRRGAVQTTMTIPLRARAYV
jgi:hypothetical protein